jgi:putative heme iron utilization protein
MNPSTGPVNFDPASASALARRLVRAAHTATLSSALAPSGSAALPTTSGGWPYGSLVLVAADHGATPILLISTLAEHTRNIQADPRVSLLFDGTMGLAEPLTGPRVTLLGRAAITDRPDHRARFLARHPGAAQYADFRDFAFYAVTVERAHLVAGFGRICWIDAATLRYAASSDALASAEADILRHMNDDHEDAIQLYAQRLLRRAGTGWTMTGCDPEGIDLRQGPEHARLDFDHPVGDAEALRAELIALAKRARAIAASEQG